VNLFSGQGISTQRLAHVNDQHIEKKHSSLLEEATVLKLFSFHRRSSPFFPPIAVKFVDVLQWEQARTGWLRWNDSFREQAGCDSCRNGVVHEHTQESDLMRWLR
jgi:hypothetical protein